MKLIMVLGAQESSKDALVDLVVKSAADTQLKLTYLHFQDMMEKWSWTAKDEQSAFRKNLNKKLSTLLAERLKKGGGALLVSGYVTVETPAGLIPLLRPELFGACPPDMMVLLEDTIRRVSGKSEQLRRLARQQQLNRIYAALYSAVAGAPLNMVSVDPRHLRPAYEGLIGLLKEVVG